MPSFFDRFGLLRLSQRSTGSSSLNHDAADTKTGVVTGAYSDASEKGQLGQASSIEPAADQLVAPGELSFEEDTAGGLGRHLGLTTTTLLM